MGETHDLERYLPDSKIEPQALPERRFSIQESHAGNQNQIGAQPAFAQMGHSDSACLMGMFAFGNRLSSRQDEDEDERELLIHTSWLHFLLFVQMQVHTKIGLSDNNQNSNLIKINYQLINSLDIAFSRKTLFSSDPRL